MKMSDHVWGPDAKGRAHPGFNILVADLSSGGLLDCCFSSSSALPQKSFSFTPGFSPVTKGGTEETNRFNGFYFQ
jgi:hypothetical protein